MLIGKEASRVGYRIGYITTITDGYQDISAMRRCIGLDLRSGQPWQAIEEEQEAIGGKRHPKVEVFL